MNDRELLEMAAKAAGLDFSWNAQPLVRCNEPEFPRKTHNIWNPIDDDGDALRLAVKLRFDVNSGDGNSAASWAVDGRHLGNSVTEPHDGDPCAATRRAIVRAAAEVDKGISHPVTDGLPEDNYYKTQAEAEGKT